MIPNLKIALFWDTDFQNIDNAIIVLKKITLA